MDAALDPGDLREGAGPLLLGHAHAVERHVPGQQAELDTIDRDAAAGEVGTPQIRNAGTVGGNVNQRPRCWYFRNEEFNCFKKGGSYCFAVAGEINQWKNFHGAVLRWLAQTLRSTRLFLVLK